MRQTWDDETEPKKLVEYWHVCLGSDYSKGKPKLDEADEYPNEKRGNHQSCP